jgi:hypothetical protein
MSSIPSITKWIETALTTVAVRPEMRENLREELEQWLAKATSVQVSVIDFSWAVLFADFSYVGNSSGCDAS